LFLGSQIIKRRLFDEGLNQILKDFYSGGEGLGLEMDDQGVVGLGGAGEGLFQNYGTVLGQVYWADLGDGLGA
jgi:hypothetical protein